MDHQLLSSIAFLFLLANHVFGCIKYVPDLGKSLDPLPLPKTEETFTFKIDKVLPDCTCGTDPAVSWTALIRVSSNGTSYFCGGSLINSRYVLTTATCLLGKDVQQATILDLFGTIYPELVPAQTKKDIDVWLLTPRTHFVDVRHTPGFKVRETVTYPAFWKSKILRDNDGFEHDNIALLKLPDEVPLTNPSSPVPICLLPLQKIPIQALVNTSNFLRSDPASPSCSEEVLMDKQESVNADIEDDETILSFCKNVDQLHLRNFSVCINGLKSSDGKEPFGKKEEHSPSSATGNLCTIRIEASLKEGWPLYIIVEDGGKQTQYMIGQSTWNDFDIVSEENQLTSHQYYTAISGRLDFILQESQTGATWCKDPNFPEIGKGSAIPISQILQHVGRPGHEEDDVHLPWFGFTSHRRNTLNNCRCGTHSNVGRIAGGVTASPGEFKWQVLLKFNFPRGTTTCGGSIINSKMVLTAAHCVIDDSIVELKINDRTNLDHPAIEASKVEVYFGLHDKKLATPAKRIAVKRVHFQPKYVLGLIEKRSVNSRPDFDVALLELEEEIQFDSTLIPVCLPTTAEANNLKFEGEVGTVSGWGLTDPNKEGSDAEFLQKLDLEIRDLSFCNDNIRNPNIHGQPHIHLCVGTLNSFKDAARGDSGGPFSIKVNRDQYLQVGLVSFGFNIGNPQLGRTASFMTDLRGMLEFIDFHSLRAKSKWCSRGNA